MGSSTLLDPSKALSSVNSRVTSLSNGQPSSETIVSSPRSLKVTRLPETENRVLSSPCFISTVTGLISVDVMLGRVMTQILSFLLHDKGWTFHSLRSNSGGSTGKSILIRKYSGDVKFFWSTCMRTSIYEPRYLKSLVLTVKVLMSLS